MNIFCELECLTEKSRILSGQALRKKWFKKSDKRYIGQALQKFIDYNQENFHFLSAYPKLTGIDKNTNLLFSTNSYVGAVPLRAPDTGKQIGDFIVSPRYFGSDRYKELIDLLSLLEHSVPIETKDSFQLLSGHNFHPPLYLEALKFINSFNILLTKKWNRFSVFSTIESKPSSNVNWTKYANNSHKVESHFKFPVRKNILSLKHNGMRNLVYVFKFCEKILFSNTTPLKIRIDAKTTINRISKIIASISSLPVAILKIERSDSPIVKICKEQANDILSRNFKSYSAWRIDIAKLFETFVQYIFKEVSVFLGAKSISNPKIPNVSSKSFDWQLKHLEPDIGLHYQKMFIPIDAKYKSHLFNKKSSSEKLKEEFRKDLHQIMSYSSFDPHQKKICFLVYPSNKYEIHDNFFSNLQNKTFVKSYILGIPFNKDFIRKAVPLIVDKINESIN